MLELEPSELCDAEACVVVVAVPEPLFAVVDSRSLFIKAIFKRQFKALNLAKTEYFKYVM